MENLSLPKLRDRLAQRIDKHALLVKSLIPAFTESEKSQISKALEERAQVQKDEAAHVQRKEAEAEAKAKQQIDEKQATVKAEARNANTPANANSAPAP